MSRTEPRKAVVTLCTLPGTFQVVLREKEKRTVWDQVRRRFRSMKLREF